MLLASDPFSRALWSVALQPLSSEHHHPRPSRPESQLAMCLPLVLGVMLNALSVFRSGVCTRDSAAVVGTVFPRGRPAGGVRGLDLFLSLSRGTNKDFGVRLSGVLLIDADFCNEGVGVGVGVPRDDVSLVLSFVKGSIGATVRLTTLMLASSFGGKKSEFDDDRLGVGGNCIGMGGSPTLTQGRTVYVRWGSQSSTISQYQRRVLRTVQI